MLKKNIYSLILPYLCISNLITLLLFFLKSVILFLICFLLLIREFVMVNLIARYYSERLCSLCIDRFTRMLAYFCLSIKGDHLSQIVFCFQIIGTRYSKPLFSTRNDRSRPLEAVPMLMDNRWGALCMISLLVLHELTKMIKSNRALIFSCY